MKKSIWLLITVVIAQLAVAQTPEIKSIKRFMSLGERNGFKTSIPNQNVKSLEKIQNSYLKSLNAENVKAAKGNTELIFSNLYLKGIDQPLMLFTAMEQEGNHVGYYTYFTKKDSTEIESNESMKELITMIYKKSMIALYDDSIKVQSKTVEKAEGELKNLSKDREKADKNIAKAKSSISGLEKDQEKSKGIISEKNSKITEYSTKKADAESKLSEVKKSESVVNSAKDELKTMTDNHKKMTKNLKDLQKDPALNANLIVAQTNDITALEAKIVEKQAAYKTLESDFKSKLKGSEKDVDNAKDLLKDSEKDIKCETKNIEKYTNKINDLKKEISDNEKTIESFESTEKKKKQDEIDALNTKLNELKASQKQYQ